MGMHSLSRFSAVAVAAFFAISTVSAQKTGGTGGGTGGGGGNVPPPTTPRPTTPTTPTPGATTPTMPLPSDIRRPIFLSGKVLTSDGTPPPEPVKIERVCQGYVRPEGYTDSKGRFSITLGQNNAMVMTDASESSFDPLSRSMNQMGGANQGVDQRQLMTCDLRAALPGYRSDTISLANRRSLDNPDVGTIILHRLANVEGLTVSATTGLAPKDAKKAFDKAREVAMKGKLDEAVKHMTKAVEIYPKYAVAWYELGRMQLAQKNPDGARESFQKALEADSKYVSPYEALADMAARENKWQDVLDLTDRALRLNPVEIPNSYLLNAMANLNLRHVDAAEKSANEMMKSDLPKRNPKAYHVMGLIHAQKGDFKDAADDLRKYVAVAPPGPGLELAKQQLAEVEKRASVAPAATPTQKP